MARVNVVNNLVTFYDATLPGGVRNSLWQISRGVDRTVTPNAQGVPHEMVFQHNTTISAASTPCWASIYFTTTAPTDAHITNNIWILDNVLCREIHGAFGGLGQTGTTGLVRYMGDPAPIDVRLAGNAMFVEPKARDLGNASNPEPATWPAHNLATTKPFVFDSNHALLTPDMSKYTSDGKQAGFIPVQVTPPRPPPPPPNPNLGRAYCDSGTTTPAHCSTWTRVM
jgi:hypothetical protein